MVNAGVFICKCGFNIAGVINVERVAEAVEGRGYFAKVVDYACSEAGQQEIAEDIKERSLDCFVVAACSPKLHEHTFRKLAEKAGINPYRVVMANIREQCSWVHRGEGAQKKAEELTLMALERVKNSKPLKKRKLKSVKRAVVVGGGIAGIEASLMLANSGIEVILVEKRASLGGHMALLNEIFPNNDCSICVLAPKMNEVWEHEKIRVYTHSEVTSVEGSAGRFKVKIRVNPRYVNTECKGCIEDCSSVCPVTVYDEFLGSFRKAIYVPFPQSTPLYAAIDEENCIRCDLCVKACEPDAIDFSQRAEEFEVEAGAVIVATGYKLFNPEEKKEYFFDGTNRIITSLELERLLSPSGQLRFDEVFSDVKKVAFIQCVGSRDVSTNPHCSVVCCMASTKNAMILRRRYGVDTAVFYTDLRAGGRGYEEYYRKAMSEGVRFVRAKPAILPEDGKVILRYEDTLLGRVVEESFDLVVLAVGMSSSGDFEFVNTGKDKFVEVLHPKLKPAETSRAGIFVAGCASGPKDIRDSIHSAGLASAKALEILSGDVELDPYYAYSVKECSGCGVCVKLCPSGAISVERRERAGVKTGVEENGNESVKSRGKASINPNACKMCGLCASACPEEAIDQGFYSNAEILAEISQVSPESVVVFACNYCAYSALDLAGALRMNYDDRIRVIRVPCSGRVSVKMLLEALRAARGVVLAGCRIGECHFGVNELVKKRAEALKELLGESGKRLKTIWCSAGEAEAIVRELNEFVSKLDREG